MSNTHKRAEKGDFAKTVLMPGDPLRVFFIAETFLEDVRLNHKLPLLIEIPDRHGTGRAPDFITSFVNESIGLKL